MEAHILDELYGHYCQSVRVVTDSREVQPGDLFFALKGDTFDGNSFALKAIEDGATLAIVDNPELSDYKQCYYVPDTLDCLQKLASHHRSQLRIPVVGITGSNGKTTTKELINAVLSEKFRCIATRGNLNNHIGVPLSILSIKPEDEIAVIEMGANHPGEIAFLCSISQPNYGLITNIGKAHLEGFGDYEGVIKTKNELYQYLQNTNGLVFTPSSSELLMKLSNNTRRIRYGQRDDDNCRGYLIDANPMLSLRWDSHIVKTSLIGDYNFDNVMAAIAIGSYFGCTGTDILHAISNYEPTNNRSQVKQGRYNIIIMDAYNANPSSMEAALKNFAAMKHSRKAIILGDMLELGKVEQQEHENILNIALALNPTELLLTGNMFHAVNKGRAKSFETSIETAKWIRKNPMKDFLILVKGSRGIHLEFVYEYL
jgi:UDP-N-acetylmuramoyl-tripeptide--D-alanyl-D-alanine ligase